MWNSHCLLSLVSVVFCKKKWAKEQETPKEYKVVSVLMRFQVFLVAIQPNPTTNGSGAVQI